MPHDFLELTDRLERAYSARLALRRLSLADAWPLFEATRNPLFNKFLLWDPPSGEGDVLRRIDAIVEAERRGRLSAVSGVVRQTGEWASLFRFQPYGRDPEAMEMGVWTHDRFWVGRLTLELSHMCIDATFGFAPVRRLIGAAAPENRASCSLMRAAGMKPTEVVVRRTESGRAVELQEFELLRADWLRRAEARRARPSHEIFEADGPASVPAPASASPLAAARRPPAAVPGAGRDDPGEDRHAHRREDRDEDRAEDRAEDRDEDRDEQLDAVG